MTSCAFCALAASKEGLVYEDGALIALMHPKPASPGHMVVLPKEHVPVFELLPPPVAGKLLGLANRLAGAAFEALPGLGGTNLVVQSGPAAGQETPHAAVHVIPRREADGLAFEPPRHQLPDDAMAAIEEGLRTAVEDLAKGPEQKPEPAPKKAEEPVEKKPERKGDDEHGWAKRQLRRMP